jgi:hypothetical protein
MAEARKKMLASDEYDADRYGSPSNEHGLDRTDMLLVILAVNWIHVKPQGCAPARIGHATETRWRSRSRISIFVEAGWQRRN